MSYCCLKNVLFHFFQFFCMSNIDPKEYVCYGGPLLCPTVV